MTHQEQSGPEHTKQWIAAAHTLLGSLFRMLLLTYLLLLALELIFDDLFRSIIAPELSLPVIALVGIGFLLTEEEGGVLRKHTSSALLGLLGIPVALVSGALVFFQLQSSAASYALPAAVVSGFVVLVLFWVLYLDREQRA